MTRRRAILATAALATAGMAAFVFLRAPSPSPPPAGSATTPGRAAPASTAVVPRNPPVAVAGAGVAQAVAPVRLGASQQVATVNGTAITGRQLLAWHGRDPAEQEMTPEMFASLKDRAIERALTFEEARRQGVDLGPAALAQLAEVRKNAQARGETDPDELDLEEADARTHLLASALLEKAGVPAPFATDADVKRYYEAHPGEFDPLPDNPEARRAAWKKIELAIRQTLAVELPAQYQRRVRAYFDQLRAKARITD